MCFLFRKISSLQELVVLQPMELINAMRTIIR